MRTWMTRRPFERNVNTYWYKYTDETSAKKAEEQQESIANRRRDETCCRCGRETRKKQLYRFVEYQETGPSPGTYTYYTGGQRHVSTVTTQTADIIVHLDWVCKRCIYRSMLQCVVFWFLMELLVVVIARKAGPIVWDYEVGRVFAVILTVLASVFCVGMCCFFSFNAGNSIAHKSRFPNR